MHGFFSLASGSKGNCYYLGTQNTKVLIDLGITKTSVTRKLLSMGVHPEEIQAIFISHEHFDHISGLKSFVKAYNIPIICNLNTAKAIHQQNNQLPQFYIFSTGISFEFQDLTVETFSIPHDAEDPVGFIFYYQNQKLGVCTDLGWGTSWVTQALYDCDYLFIESNHDPELVKSSQRPNIYKKRVLSKTGHLSNQACGLLLQQILTPKIQQIYLAHLSSKCNTAQLALDTVTENIHHLTSIKPIIVQSSDISQPIYFDTFAHI